MSATGRTPWFRRRRRDRDEQPSSVVPPDPVEGERRQLTVMFVDLVGSTEMAERHEPEVVRDVLRRYHELCGAAVSAHHGHIARYEGDGVMVYFGFPKAREDDARQAVLAGLELLGRLAGAAADIRRDRGIEFTARVGIHTGVVLVAELGLPDTPAHDAVIGAAPNQAARIQALAPPGALVISDDTYEIVRGYFDVESLGSPSLKGIDRDVEVLRVLRPTDAMHRLEAAGPVRTRLVGRQAERQRLGEWWHDAEAPSTAAARGAMLIRGEAGIGKSRLAEEIVAEALASSAIVLTAYCAPDRRASRLYPIAAMLERRFQLVADDDAATGIKKLEDACVELELDDGAVIPYLAEVLAIPVGERYALPRRDPHLVRELTFGALSSVLLAHARRHRALLLVEDLQWSDETTLELLARLAKTSPTSALLVLGTARPEFSGWWAARDAVVDLQRLPAADHMELIQELADQHGVPEGRWPTIASRSDGNPLFTEELVKALAGGEGSGDTIPRTVRDLLAARLDGLDDDKGLAQTASVLGREIDVEVLRDVSGLSPRQLDAGLAHLTDAGILEALPSAPAPVTHQFVHALVRDAAYESQEQERRFRTHRRAAEALAIRPNGDPGLIAQHFDAARAADEAVGWYLIAGAGAQATAADAEAIRHLDRAHELVMAQTPGSVRDVTELNVHILRGTSHVNMRGYGAPGAASDFSRSLELSEQMTSGADVVPLTAAVWAYYLVHGELRAAEDAARRLEAMSTPEFDAEILCCLGAQRFFQGRISESREFLEASVARFDARAADARVALRWLLPSDPLAVALTHLGCVLWLVGDVAGATTRLAQATERARSLTEYPRGAFTEAYVCSYAAWVAILAGRFADGLALHEEAGSIAARYGMLFWAVAGTSGRAIGVGLLGSPRDAIEMLAPSLEQWRDLGAGAFLPFVRAQRALLHLQLHEGERALQDIDFALEHATRTSEDFFSAEAHRIRAAILLELDPQLTEEARAELMMARDLAARQGALVFELRAALDLAEFERDDSRAVDAVRELVMRMHGATGLAELERVSSLLTA